MNLLVKWIISAFAVMLGSYLLPDYAVHVSSFVTALVVAAVLGILNVLVKPVLVILTIPLTIFTLGLFLLVINAVVILMADALIGGFSVGGFWWALLFSIVLTTINGLLNALAEK